MKIGGRIKREEIKCCRKEEEEKLMKIKDKDIFKG